MFFSQVEKSNGCFFKLRRKSNFFFKKDLQLKSQISNFNSKNKKAKNHQKKYLIYCALGFLIKGPINTCGKPTMASKEIFCAYHEEHSKYVGGAAK